MLCASAKMCCVWQARPPPGWLAFVLSTILLLQAANHPLGFGFVEQHACDLLVKSPTGRDFLLPLHEAESRSILAAADVDGHTFS